MKKVLVLLAPGFEEIETVTPLDLLNRAGVENTLAVVGNAVLLEGRSGIFIKADTTLDALSGTHPNAFKKLAEDFDALFIPGGPGTWTLLADGRAAKIARAFAEKKKLVAAICAAPLVLNAAGLLAGKRVSAHDCAWNEIPTARNSVPVEFDSNLLTSRGAGTAFAFAIAFVEKLCGKAIAQEIATTVMA